MSALNAISKYIFIILIAATVAFGIYWLWQRQPRLKEEIESATKLVNVPHGQQDEELSIKPANLSLIKSANFTAQGKTKPESYVLLYSDDHQTVLKTDKNGNFEQDLEMEEGLILMSMTTVSKDLNQVSTKSIIWWVEQKPQTDAKNVIAGPVKTIFGNVLAIIADNSEITTRTTAATEFDIPQIKGESTKQSTASAVSNVRVGDYAIALGNLTENNTLNATSLQIIRENKPQILKKLMTGKIATVNTAKNTFVAKDNKTSDSINFSLDKNSKVSMSDREGDKSQITQGKSAFIFYNTEGDKNLADLVYLLP